MNLDADDFNKLYPVGSKVVTHWGEISLTKKPAVLWSDGISRVALDTGYPCDLKSIVRVIPDVPHQPYAQQNHQNGPRDNIRRVDGDEKKALRGVVLALADFPPAVFFAEIIPQKGGHPIFAPVAALGRAVFPRGV
ncbi:MAG: hypothetical protein ABSF38_14210 [Verrucomicrobiota bacterium]